jgi:hypothetical protein
MFGKTIIALFAIAAIGLAAPTAASARGGFHHHGGGFGGFGVGLGLGLMAPFALGGYPYGYGYTGTVAAIWFGSGFGHHTVGACVGSKCAADAENSGAIFEGRLTG